MPVAQGLRHEMRYFYAKDDTKLFRQAWLPEEKARGAVIIVHGLKEYGELYAELGQQLALKGYATYALDLRGHGYSGGAPQSVNQFNDYLVDLALMIRSARSLNPETPIFLLGNDLGGTIAARFVQMIPNAVQGVVLSAPLVKAQESKYKLAALKVLAALAPSSSINRLNIKTFSNNTGESGLPPVDPLISKAGVPARTAKEGLSAMQAISEEASKISTPTLLLHGVNDDVAPLFGSIALYDEISAEKKSLQQYANMGHDLWHQEGSQQVVQDLTAWLDGLSNKN